jgi:CubicO group peptidase (beta-lactamase class C family)
MADVVAGLKELLNKGIEDGVAPGMACAIGDADQTWFAEAGRFTYNAKSPAVTEETLWDVASLTKIVATTSVAMALYQEHVLDLDAHVQSVVAEFVGDDKDEVTVRNLLLHDSGLPAYLELKKHTNALAAKDEVLRSALRAAPCTRTDYSCLGFITLMELMQRLTGLGMDELVRKYVTSPLGMSDTFYKPGLEDRSRCAPTEKYEPWRKELEDLRGFKRVHETYVQGIVHDPIAFVIGGISGNAGLFSTSRDLARVARAWMLSSPHGPVKRGASTSRGGERATVVSPFASETVATFAHKQEEKSTRGLGFDTRSEEDSSAGTKFSMRSFGHTGYTGTTIWVDPENQLFAVLLTNRVHPTAANMKIRDFRPELHDAVFGLLTA